VVHRKPPARAPESGDHLVRDEEQAVLSQIRRTAGK
jgi:hypothetical protein